MFPGRREEAQGFPAVRAAAGDERTRQFVHVFADAGSLAQRRSVVEQNPQVASRAESYHGAPVTARVFLRRNSLLDNRLTGLEVA